MSHPTESTNGATVLVNAGAGGGHGEDLKTKLEDSFRAAGLTAKVHLVHGGEGITKLVRGALGSGQRLIVAGGGDGTVNAVASELVDQDAVLGVLPMGTLNHFAKDVGIPVELEAAVANIAAGHTTQVDTAEVNGRVFINNSSIGLYPDMVRTREQQQERLGKSKWPAFVSACLHTLRRYPVLRVQIETDGKEMARQTPFVFIGNNEYQMEGFNIGARASVCDGKLSLYVSQQVGRFGLFRLALRALAGRLQQARDFDIVNTREAVIHTRRARIRVATDGEVNMFDTPLHYRVRPCSLTVIVPAPEPGDAA